MKIRTQLGLFFAVMAFIIMAFGALTVWGGARVADTFSKSLKDMEKISKIRGLQVVLARQKASLDTYFVVGDPQELERFHELIRLVTSRLEEMERLSPGDGGVRELQSLYGDVVDSSRQVIRLYQTDKGRALARASDVLLPKVLAFFEAVNTSETNLSRQIYETRNRVRHWVRRAGQGALLAGLGGALLGLLFALSTYRSLSRSLKVLQEGAEAFGVGKWDYRIDLPAPNELGDLARSFNEMAENVKQLEIQTVHMHRMSAVGQLAGGVAHEINNPLTGVLGQAQLLLDKLPADDPRRLHIEKIERAALRCRRIVRSLLDFSRQKESQFTEFNVNETVEAALDLCELDLQGARVTVLKNLSAGIPAIMGNASQLQQVFLNIATNAIQAMPGGGVLTISTRMGSFVPPGQPDKKKVEGVEVNFLDTGIGIDPAHLSHVFEPFFTTKEIGKGTGLGLSVSLGIVRHHGGDVLVESGGPEKGAVFRVFLPTGDNVPAADEKVVGVGAWGAAGEGGAKNANPRY